MTLLLMASRETDFIGRRIIFIISTFQFVSQFFSSAGKLTARLINVCRLASKRHEVMMRSVRGYHGYWISC